MTTKSLQQNATDFHILPSCNATKCVAAGTFINDDGLSLDTTQRYTYNFTYEHDVVTTTPVSPTTMTVQIKTGSVATPPVPNGNDYLNKIKIYDATTFGMDTTTATYSVTVNFVATANKDPLSLGNATWNDRGDKLEITAPNSYRLISKDAVLLSKVDTIVFTKA